MTSSLRFSISAICSTSLLVILSCQRILSVRLKRLARKTLISCSSFFFVVHVSQPYIKTSLTKVLHSLIFVRRLILTVNAPDLPQPHKYPSGFDYSIVDVLCASTFQISQRPLPLPIHFNWIIYSRIFSCSLHISTLQARIQDFEMGGEFL